MKDYDVIIIGAGNGGLAAAVTLSLRGKSVAVFEKHNLPGGCGTSFRRGRFEFEVALHQLSSMGTSENPGPLRKQFREYGIENQIDWIEIRDLFRVNLPDGRGYTIPADRRKAEQSLSESFPEEKHSIHRYFDRVWWFCEEANAFAEKSAASSGEPPALKKLIMKTLFPKLYPTLAKYGLRSTQDVMDEFFKTKELQLCLSAYWCFMGMPPNRFPFSILAKCTYIYLTDKPFYLRGGSQVMSQALTETIRKNGGDVYLSDGVAEILLKDGAACGVIDEKGREFRCKKIISNISPTMTYTRLLKKNEIPFSARDYLKPYTVGISALTCFFGLDCPPEELGFTNSFTLNYDSLNANEDFLGAYSLLPEHDPIVATCYTVDDPEGSPAGTSVITAGSLKYSAPWEALPPEKYHEMKFKAADIIITRLEKQYPKLREHIEELEIATPLTHMRYLTHPGGAIYGYEQDLKSSVFFFPTESRIPNLEFASGWVNACGFGPNYMYADKVAKRIAEEADVK